jgi:hypothetical protein
MAGEAEKVPVSGIFSRPLPHRPCRQIGGQERHYCGKQANQQNNREKRADQRILFQDVHGGWEKEKSHVGAKKLAGFSQKLSGNRRRRKAAKSSSMPKMLAGKPTGKVRDNQTPKYTKAKIRPSWPRMRMVFPIVKRGRRRKYAIMPAAYGAVVAARSSQTAVHTCHKKVESFHFSHSPGNASGHLPSFVIAV